MKFNILDKNKSDFDFNKYQTNIAKGIAILMLLWHHTFFNNEEIYNSFISMFFFRGIPIECFLADFGKVCVSIFLFLSGFGLYKSYSKNCQDNTNIDVKFHLKFVLRHMINLYSSYWIIWVLFVPLGCFFGRNILELYENNFIYLFIDFFGLSYLFGTPTANESWWFMSLIIILYLVFPLVIRFFHWSPEAFLCLSFILLIYNDIRNLSFSHRPPSIMYFGKFFVWILPFALGIYFSYYGLLEKILSKNKHLLKRILFCILAFFFSVAQKFIIDNRIHTDFIICLAIILISFLIVSRIPIVSFLLSWIGQYSGLIYMFHSFIILYYFHELYFSLKYSLVIFVAIVLSCCLIAVFITYFKRLIRVDKLTNNILL